MIFSDFLFKRALFHDNLYITMQGFYLRNKISVLYQIRFYKYACFTSSCNQSLLMQNESQTTAFKIGSINYNI